MLLLSFAASPAASSAAAACPNEALRAGPSAALPECRAYEMVSPPEKGGGAVLGIGRVQIGPGAESALFLSTTALPGAPASPFKVADLAGRADGSGWSTTPIDPPTYNPAFLLEDATLAISEDFGTSLQLSHVALAPGAIEGGSNLYLRDDATGALRTIAAEAGEALINSYSNLSGLYFGGSPDWGHLLLGSTVPLAEGVPPEVPHVYDFTGGHFEVVDRLPSGEVPAAGAVTYSDSPGGSSLRGVSADGSRVYFSVGGGVAPLYLREDNATTVAVSASQQAGASAEATPVIFDGASSDGSVAYFTSSEDLTATSHNHGFPSLYRYEVATGKLSELTPSAKAAKRGAGIDRVLAVSEDGSYVYFSASGALTPDAEVTEGVSNLYAWHEGTLKLVGRTVVGGEATQAETSPDGTHLALATVTPLTATDVESPSCTGGPNPGHCREVFVYDYATGSLACASCDGPSRGDSSLGTLDEAYVGLNGKVGQAVLEDGAIVLDTPNALVPRDSNGVGDVYLWRAGVPELISSGTSGQASNFAEATPDGSDIFFRTDQPLVGIDRDAVTDLYDARVDGGLAGQNPPAAGAPCEGEACRGASPQLKALRPGAVSAPPVSGCDLLDRRARHLARKAKTLAKKARAVRGGAVARRRRIAVAAHEKAKRAAAHAGTCRKASR